MGVHRIDHGRNHPETGYLAMVTRAPVNMVTEHSLLRIQPSAISLSSLPFANNLRGKRGDDGDDAGVSLFEVALSLVAQSFLQSRL